MTRAYDGSTLYPVSTFCFLLGGKVTYPLLPLYFLFSTVNFHLSTVIFHLHNCLPLLTLSKELYLVSSCLTFSYLR